MFTPRFPQQPVRPALQFLLGILLVLSAQVHAQQATVYATRPDGSKLTLYIPSVMVGNNQYGNVWLDVVENNHLVIDRFVTLGREERDILQFLEATPCSPLGNLERLAAYKAYRDPGGVYCLRLAKHTTVEGGTIFVYVLIENQALRYVFDNRLDGLGACCFHLVDTLPGLQLGTPVNGDFVETGLPASVDLDDEYRLRLIDSSGRNYDF